MGTMGPFDREAPIIIILFHSGSRGEVCLAVEAFPLF